MFKEVQEVSRRQFTAIAGASAVASAAALASGQASYAKADEASETETTDYPSLADQVWDFEKEPEYDLDSITDEETHEVIVVGAASSGMACIYKLLENGVDVCAIEKLTSDSVVIGGITYRRSVGFNQASPTTASPTSKASRLKSTVLCRTRCASPTTRSTRSRSGAS